MSTSILFLVARMQRGYGVSVVVYELGMRLVARGIKVTVACLTDDGTFANLDIRVIRNPLEDVRKIAGQVSSSHLIAHTSPFLELLPQFNELGAIWAWEHGDPDPEFFPYDAFEREQQIVRKRNSVYPICQRVIAISAFVKSQLQHQSTQIIYNGIEHLDVGISSSQHSTQSRYDIGTICRFGPGESRYKGLDEYIEIIKKLTQRHSTASAAIFGRGSNDDAESLSRHGLSVLANGDDKLREQFLKDQINIFMAPSLWEGCNLPLLEAQAAGVASFAFDTGAHPEYARYCVGSVTEAVLLADFWIRSPNERRRAASNCYNFVRRQFSWDKSTDTLVELLQSD